MAWNSAAADGLSSVQGCKGDMTLRMMVLARHLWSARPGFMHGVTVDTSRTAGLCSAGV